MLTSKRAVFARIPMFAGLTPEEVDSLAQSAVEKQFAEGDFLFHEGEPCEGLYLVGEGAVKIFKTSPSGRQITLGVQPAPSTVAEVPLFDGGALPASVQALDEVTALFIHKKTFHEICIGNPGVALKMLAVVGRRLRTLVGIIESVTFGSVRQRIAQSIVQWSETAQSDQFEMPMTHQELALHLGTVREVVSRNLSRFQIEGLIRFSRREIVLLNKEGLRAEAETEF
jgi:CRP-like cAMP-binding protein